MHKDDKKGYRDYSGSELVQMRDQLKNDRDIFISLRETCRFFFKPQDKIYISMGTHRNISHNEFSGLRLNINQHLHTIRHQCYIHPSLLIHDIPGCPEQTKAAMP